MARKKTTVYLDPALVRAVKVVAASSGRHDYEIVEDAIRQYLGNLPVSVGRRQLADLLQSLGERAELTDDAALALAYSELRAARRARSHS
jgi:hypothetical protein